MEIKSKVYQSLDMVYRVKFFQNNEQAVKIDKTGRDYFHYQSLLNSRLDVGNEAIKDYLDNLQLLTEGDYKCQERANRENTINQL